MKSSIIWIIVVVVFIALGGWYWWANSSPSAMVPVGQAALPPGQGGQTSNTTITTTTTTTTNSTPGLAIVTNKGPGPGTYLTGSNGMTLYTYTKDTAGVSNCMGTCASNWPPYVVTDTSSFTNLETGITGKVATLTRADGTMQVTYKGKPLYFYVKDMQVGDAKGQGVGGVWFVATP